MDNDGLSGLCGWAHQQLAIFSFFNLFTDMPVSINLGYMGVEMEADYLPASKLFGHMQKL